MFGNLRALVAHAAPHSGLGLQLWLVGIEPFAMHSGQKDPEPSRRVVCRVFWNAYFFLLTSSTVFTKTRNS